MSEQPEQPRNGFQQLSDEDAKKYLDNSAKLMKMLMAGPKVWENIPSVEIRPESVGNYVAASMLSTTFLEQTFITCQQQVAHAFVDSLIGAMTHWAQDNGREDLLSTVSQRLERAVALDSDD